MRTLNVAITESEFVKYGFKKEDVKFNEFIEIIRKELFRQNLNETIEIAYKYGLSNMTMEEITSEVKAVRNHEKSYN